MNGIVYEYRQEHIVQNVKNREIIIQLLIKIIMTEERVTLGISDDCVMQEHLDRYNFAIKYVKDKIILDLACGTGYGTSIISYHAKNIIGADISQEAIDYARSHFKRDNLLFIKNDILDLPFADNSVDIIISFETIEHITNYELFLKECKRMLRPDGIFICSTPNAEVSSPDGVINNQYHVKEFTKDEFINILTKYFNVVNLYGQHDINMRQLQISRFIIKIKKLLKINKHVIPRKHTNLSFPVGQFKNNNIKSVYMVAVCNDKGTKTN